MGAVTTRASKPETVRQILGVAAQWLSERGVDEARLDTELLLAHVLGIERLGLYLDHDRPLMRPELERFRALMRRRGEGREPVAYLLGERGFHGIDLEVAPGVLIPRPETELLVELGEVALARLRSAGRTDLCFADVGTGSGCVALALATAEPLVKGVACDRSADALRVAARNRERLGLGARVALVQADLLSFALPASLDLVLSNPPYVLETERDLLAPEILDHEPHQALFDAPGLPLTRRLVTQARAALRPGGVLAIETGFDKAHLLGEFFSAAGFVDVERIEDLGGVERVVQGRLPE
jgi:release factor glutamine methyltransferase